MYKQKNICNGNNCGDAAGAKSLEPEGADRVQASGFIALNVLEALRRALLPQLVPAPQSHHDKT